MMMMCLVMIMTVDAFASPTAGLARLEALAILFEAAGVLTGAAL